MMYKRLFFHTQISLYGHLVMLFGLSKAPAVFQTIVNYVFHNMLSKFHFVYLDDILTFSQDLKS